MADDPILPRYRLLSDDPTAYRAAKRPELHIFEGDYLVCVTTSEEYSQRIIAALTTADQRKAGPEIEEFRMKAAGQAFGTATKRKLKAAIQAYLTAKPPFQDVEVAFG